MEKLILFLKELKGEFNLKDVLERGDILMILCIYILI